MLWNSPFSEILFGSLRDLVSTWRTNKNFLNSQIFGKLSAHNLKVWSEHNTIVAHKTTVSLSTGPRNTDFFQQKPENAQQSKVNRGKLKVFDRNRTSSTHLRKTAKNSREWDFPATFSSWAAKGGFEPALSPIPTLIPPWRRQKFTFQSQLLCTVCSLHSHTLALFRGWPNIRARRNSFKTEQL